MKWTPTTLKQYTPSFALRINIDFNHFTVHDNGKKFYSTKDGGCLVIHPCGVVQLFNKNWFDL